jgi:hypothetical protein
MPNQRDVSVANLDHIDVCYVRCRRIWPWGSHSVYEAVGTRGNKIEVLATSRKVPSEGAAAAAALLQLNRDLQRDGWTLTEEPRRMGHYFVTCYTRPVRRKPS